MSLESPRAAHAIFVEYQRRSGNMPTGAESAILGKLTGRGFPVQDYGTSSNLDPDTATLTILLGEHDERAVRNAVAQLENIITVTKAELRPLADVYRYCHASAEGLTDDEHSILRKGHRANLHQTALFPDTDFRKARKVNKALRDVAKSVRVSKQDVQGEGNHQRFTHKARLINPGEKAKAVIADLGGTIRSREYVKLDANLPQVERLVGYLRGELHDKIRYLTLDAPRIGLFRPATGAENVFAQIEQDGVDEVGS